MTDKKKHKPWYDDTLNCVIVGLSGGVFAFLVALGARVALQQHSCGKSNQQFVGTRINLVGFECNHRGIYGLALVFSLLLQILRSCLRVKEGQVRRDTMQTAVGSDDRRLYLGKVAGYTFVGYVLYIISILFLVSRNLGILVMLLVGTMVGNVVAFHLQEPDRFRTHHSRRSPSPATFSTPEPFSAPPGSSR